MQKGFHDIRPKLEGSTLFDENTACMYSGVASKEAETRAIDHTLRAYELTGNKETFIHELLTGAFD